MEFSKIFQFLKNYFFFLYINLFTYEFKAWNDSKICIHQVASWYKRAKDVPESIRPIGFSPTHQ